jgi:hypothetical protein
MMTVKQFGCTKTKAQGKRGEKIQSFGGNTGFAI